MASGGFRFSRSTIMILDVIAEGNDTMTSRNPPITPRIPIRKIKVVPYLYVLPVVILMGTFVYVPMVQNFYYTLHNFSAFSTSYEFVGLENVQKLLSDPVIKTALINNVWYCIISVLFQVLLAMVIASILELKILNRVSTVFRSVYFVPVLISMTVVAMLFTQIYAPKGLLNGFLSLFGDKVRTGWLGKTSAAIFCAIAMSQWHSMGYTITLFIVAIQKIPAELYEAAEIDGAGRVRKFLNITAPQCREMMFVAMITTVSGAFLVFNDVYILTRGGPGNSSITLAVYMYNMAFTQDRMGYASSIAISMLVICLLLAVVQKRILRSGEVD